MSQLYSNPPIREAVCEFRYQDDGRWDSAAPGLIYSAMSSDFPRRLAGERPAAPPAPVAELPNLSSRGGPQLELRIFEQSPLRFWREGDEFGYIAVSPYRLSVHHFRPYPSWEVLSGIITQGAQAYQDVLNPKRVQRIGLRYINEINFSLASVELEEFFDFYPFVGQSIPQDLTRFHCLVQFDFEGARDSLILQIGNGPESESDNAQINLDLDYYLARPDAFELSQTNDWLQTAHANLESVFEGCLKDSARELFR